MFVTNKRIMSFVLIVSVFLLLFSLSAVSADTHNLNNLNDTDDVQNVINTDTDDELVINLADGNYNFGQINVSRNATIIGQSKDGVRISSIGSGTLFNITASNVKLINLTIIGYDTAIKSNSGDLTITDNNITTNDISINISSDGGDLKGISIKNNIIVSSVTYWDYGAVYIYAPDYSGAIVVASLIGNNITAKGTSNSNGVRIRVIGCSSNLTFIENNITGTDYGVALYAYRSNNTNITFTNNNITGTYGVYLYAYSSNNTNITFTNNNITGTSLGVYLDAYSSNNTNITFTNNNITGTYDGVYLDADSSNNTNITFTNNNITGTYYGVALSASSSNNTNITFTNNNITGTSYYGVYLYASSSNNTNITFNGNNIVGGQYAIYIYSYGNFSGLYLLNNTFVSGEHGLYFYLDDANLTDIVIKGNTISATNTAILFEEGSPSFVNVTVNYNRILGNIGLDYLSVSNDAGSNFDYNWWGVNDITSKVFGFDTNNHYILNITNVSSLSNVKPGDIVGFALLVLNTTLTNDGVENLPYFVINGTFNGVAYNSSTNDLFMYQFSIPNEGLHTIDASLDEEYVDLEFNATKLNTSSSVVIPDNIRVGKTINITGVVTDDDGNPLTNIGITVTVDGKTYTVITDNNGRWSLGYKPTHVGNIDVSVTWGGNTTHNGFTTNGSFSVAKGNISVKITITENDDGSVTVTANATDEDGDPVSGHTVDFIVDGESVGKGVTDGNGIASINIPSNKFGNGTHIITVSVNGGNNFNNGILSMEFAKRSPRTNNDTNDTNDTDDIDDADADDIDDTITNNNGTNNNSVALAAMKKTGIPIAIIFLVLLSCIGAIYRKK